MATDTKKSTSAKSASKKVAAAKTATPKKPVISKVENKVAASLTALYARKGDAGFMVLSMVAGVSEGRLKQLRDGDTPSLTEKAMLESLADFGV